MQTAKKIARLMRSSRKKAGLTQQSVSQRLGISQGALSKMEHGLLIPSAPQWFEFCDLTGIPSESLKLGYVDRLLTASLEARCGENGFKLPKHYSENCGSKARAVQPFLKAFRNASGDSADEFFRSLKVDPDYFLDFDNQINLNLILDVSRRMIETKVIRADNVETLVQAVLDPSSHGQLQDRYRHVANGKAALRELIANAPHYECNFDYAIEGESENGLTLSVKPREHLSAFPYRNDPVMGDFLCQYKKAYFGNFTRYAGRPSAALTEKQCHFHGADRCVYELSFAG